MTLVASTNDDYLSSRLFSSRRTKWSSCSRTQIRKIVMSSNVSHLLGWLIEPTLECAWMTCIFILACYNTCRKIVASNDHGCMRSKTITCERAVALHNSRAFLFWKSLFKANFWLNAILSTPFFNYLLVISITIIGIFKICFRIITLLILILIVIGINSIWNFSAISRRTLQAVYLFIA